MNQELKCKYCGSTNITDYGIRENKTIIGIKRNHHIYCKDCKKTTNISLVNPDEEKEKKVKVDNTPDPKSPTYRQEVRKIAFSAFGKTKTIKQLANYLRIDVKTLKEILKNK